jgi:hypothetical protein
MLDQVNKRAVEIFHANVTNEDGEIMEGSYAWVKAVAEIIKTDDDAIALVLDVRDLPQLQDHDDYVWECDGAANFVDFVKSAFYGMGLLFEPMIIAQVGTQDYNVIINERKALAHTHT